MRRAARTDGNCQSIAEAFERLGCIVHRTNSDWDLTVQAGEATVLIEVKNPDSARGRREIKSGGNERQRKMQIRRVMVTCVDDVERVVLKLRGMYAA